MSKLYRPSNGTEGEFFMAEFCYRCDKDKVFNNPCEIMGRSLFHEIDEPEYPKEWIVDDDSLSNARCTAYKPITKRENKNQLRLIK